MVNPRYLPEQHSTTRLADGRFSIAVAPEKYSELGGKGSAQLESFIRASLAKEGLCSSGFITDDPVPVRGYVSIVGRCRPTKGQP